MSNSNQNTWTDEQFDAEILRIIGEKSDMPTFAEINLIRGDRRMEWAIKKRGGIQALAAKLGLQLRTVIVWTDAMREDALRSFVGSSKVMPSLHEIRRTMGNGSLPAQLATSGGVRYWAERLGLTLKDSATKRGQDWEEKEAAHFTGLGYDVIRQKTMSSFDLLVNKKRVDVKHAKWSSYVRKEGTKGKGEKVSGFAFACLKNGKTCDFFDLVCVEGDKVKHRFIIPATSAQVQTLTISKKTLDGAGKYAFFKDRVDLLK